MHLVCRSIVELHGGRVSVYSDGEGKGCCFSVEIPVCEMIHHQHYHLDDTAGTVVRGKRLASDKRVVGIQHQNQNHNQNRDHMYLVDADHEQNPLKHARDMLEAAHSNSDTDGNHVKVVSDEKEVCEKDNQEYRYSSQQSISYNLKDLHVLVVDDAPLNRKMLRRLLNAHVAKITEAEDGLDALNQIKESFKSRHLSIRSGSNSYQSSWAEKSVSSRSISNRVGLARMASFSSYQRAAKSSVDVILMDFFMPKMDGLESSRAIRGLGYKGIIIGLTGNALSEDIEAFINHGADRVLIKPVDMTALFTTISGTFLFNLLSFEILIDFVSLFRVERVSSQYLNKYI